MRLPEAIELKHATRGVNIFLLSKLGCETFGSQLLYLWEITVNEVQFQVPHHHPDPGPGPLLIHWRPDAKLTLVHDIRN